MARFKAYMKKTSGKTPRKELVTKEKRKAELTTGLGKRKYRHRPGMKALMRMKKLTREDNLIALAPFLRLFKHYARETLHDVRMKKSAVTTARYLIGSVLNQYLIDASEVAIVAKKQTLTPEIVKSTYKICSKLYQRLDAAQRTM